MTLEMLRVSEVGDCKSGRADTSTSQTNTGSTHDRTTDYLTQA